MTQWQNKDHVIKNIIYIYITNVIYYSNNSKEKLFGLIYKYTKGVAAWFMTSCHKPGKTELP